jgi:hypothetical protein
MHPEISIVVKIANSDIPILAINLIFALPKFQTMKDDPYSCELLND